MQETVRTNNVRDDAREKRDCCTPDYSTKAALKVDPKASSGENPELGAAQTPTEAGCCCGSKSPKR